MNEMLGFHQSLTLSISQHFDNHRWRLLQELSFDHDAYFLFHLYDCNAIASNFSNSKVQPTLERFLLK